MRRRKWLPRILALLLLAGGFSARAQAQQPLARMEDLGLTLVRGASAQPGDGRRVTILGENGDGESVVGLVHSKVGDRYVVTLPDGALRSVLISETQPTDDEFKASTKKQMTEELASQFPGFRIRDTRRYIFVYNTSETFYQGTSSMLETMHPKLVNYCKRRRLAQVSVDPPPLVVVMFRTREEFRKYRDMKSESILAYYNSLSNRIILYEQSELANVAPTIAVKQAFSTIAHEGVHQILHNIGIQQRLATWPMWISEGLPEYFAPTDAILKRGVQWKGVGFPNDLRMRELLKHLGQLKQSPDKEQRPGSGKMVKDVIMAEHFTSVDYSIAWALTHYLATREKDEFFDYIREVSATQPLNEPVFELDRFTEFFGNDLARLERQMLQHIDDLPYNDPIFNQPHFLVMATTGKTRVAVLTTSPAQVKSARRDLLAKLPANQRARAQFNVQTFPNRNLGQIALRAFTNGR